VSWFSEFWRHWRDRWRGSGEPAPGPDPAPGPSRFGTTRPPWGTGTTPWAGGTTAPPSPVTVIASQLLALHNRERDKVQLPSYRLSDKLCRAADGYAHTMAWLHSSDFGHSEDGTSPADRAAAQGYNWSRIGENIAAGQQTAQAVMTAWMGSPGHRQNILGPFVDVGFGLALDQQGEPYWCADFGTLAGMILGTRGLLIVDGFAGEVVWEPPALDVRRRRG
jgi:uncharacterized protein YkwD